MPFEKQSEIDFATGDKIREGEEWAKDMMRKYPEAQTIGDAVAQHIKDVHGELAGKKQGEESLAPRVAPINVEEKSKKRTGKPDYRQIAKTKKANNEFWEK